MRLSAKTFAAMLMGLALAAFQPEMDAQSRGGSRSTSISSSRSSSSSNKQVTRPSGNTSGRPTGQPSKPSARPQSKPETPAAKPENRPRPDISPADRNPSRPSASRPAPGRPSGNKPSMDRPSNNRPHAGHPDKPKPGTPKPDFKPGNHNRPVPVHHPKPHPRDREFTHYSKPAYHWTVTPHYYGYRVRTLPINVVKHIYGGVTYYYYDNIWYRPYNGYYIVSRPPFGTSLAANLIADAAWAAVQLSYYNTVANTYSQINENNQYIAQQNAVIAQNNALIAAQNQQINQSLTKAQAAYSLANELGLIQSYAAADATYFYQDGVFYSMGTDGQYYVIVPPAGALVESLPEDFDIVILNGKEYFKVDNTVYKMTISDGKPYFEVLGQMN